ncbi:hypothetical protein [Escherichia coli]|uniref:hypothetical protein n=1 Tax=Escherichia coli TaxID=562 RepID=UPI00050A3A86|nr:hypothetical protein BCM29_00860 [Escherichia coli]
MFACSVILINSPFETIFAEKISLQKNDVLLTDNVTELRIDECIIIKYMENAGKIQHSDTAVSPPSLKQPSHTPSDDY